MIVDDKLRMDDNKIRYVVNNWLIWRFDGINMQPFEITSKITPGQDDQGA